MLYTHDASLSSEDRVCLCNLGFIFIFSLPFAAHISSPREQLLLQAAILGGSPVGDQAGAASLHDHAWVPPPLEIAVPTSRCVIWVGLSTSSRRRRRAVPEGREKTARSEPVPI
ncbi:hypothetical protein SETIT_9G069200v2 [Setaria italica]|uniref:Uncharacterized protein n=1 Tax=Setaria italica TaxID=4555 RepID=A0A368SDT7_SETIT|nr:hypothetical protein SETIT_9G069200v2 [Setaria italica]